MPRKKKTLSSLLHLRKEEQIEKLLTISENAFHKGNYRKGEAFLWKVKDIDSDYDIDGKLREVKSQKNRQMWSTIPNKGLIKHPNDTVEVVEPGSPTPGRSHFNDPTKTLIGNKLHQNDDKEVSEADNQNYCNDTQRVIKKSTQGTVNSNKKNFVNNEFKLLVKSINECFLKGNLNKAQSILDKAEELYIPADIKALKDQIQEAKLQIQKENDDHTRQKIKCLKSEKKKAFDYIEKAKEAIINRDLVTTDKCLRDTLDILTEENENFSLNIKNNTEQNNRSNEKISQYKDERDKVSDALENAIQTEAFKFIKKAEQAFFNSDFDVAEKLLLISKRISPDEYVEEMIALVESAKREDIPKERIEDLRKKFFKEFNTEQDYEINNLDFANTFRIVNGFDKAQEMLKTMENLYTEKKAKEFFRRIQTVTENQRPSNYSYCTTDTTIKESNKEEAYKCLSKAKEAYREGKFERAERLLNISERMYPTDEAKELLYDINNDINNDEYYEEEEEEAQTCLDLILPAIQANDFDKADRIIENLPSKYGEDYALCNVIKTCIDRMRDIEKHIFGRNSFLQNTITALSRGWFEKAECYIKHIDPQLRYDRLVEHLLSAIEIMKAAEKNKKDAIVANEAEKYLRQAENEIAEGNFENAVIYLNISKDVKPSRIINEMLCRLNQVTASRKDPSEGSFYHYLTNQFGEQDNANIKKDIKKAEINFVKGNFYEALHALNACNSERARRLKRVINETIRSAIYS